jgi:hypothetical protein
MKKFYYSLFALLFVVGCARTISDLILKVGNGTDADVKVEMELGKGASNPYINYNTTSDKFEVCNEGAACFEAAPDTDTNAGTICAAGEFLNGDGTCDAVPVDTNAGTVCSAGQYLDGDGTCKTAPTGGGSTSFYQSSLFSDKSLGTGTHTIASVSITTTRANQPIIIGWGGATSDYDNMYSGSTTANLQILVGGSAVSDHAMSNGGFISVPWLIHNVSTAGTYTVLVRIVVTSGLHSFGSSRLRVAVLP